MDVFALLFILSFIALLVTLVVMNLYKKWKMKSKVAKGSKHIGWVSDMLGQGYESAEVYADGKMQDVIVDKTTYEFDTSWYQREVSETQEKWKETIPKHSTRIKLRASRKIRNKRKGHSKTVRGKKK